ncbi:endolytic transglycosylase MltG [Candidatus Falkowbacteria bacterium]|jgi:UPF0755 protein|nr:endolytic transglycosylase MltG [Candidatus Falkowbacteria bacterium]MBT5503476.1 endolytic transglycosylase MltG [Candidatus Falkowbacteria bacterium]MBT6574075.1 endolytic transglycosylase MltG [Candidatus Falkowbacteria bacterium]MBT7348233.1 endolytic transglycosylase MltG [Candidatus Falkowbacteria bacterium]MBT7500212.1 endolytic transglycosylase MltG [Candidatus Falkowbacteria bacterium]
MRKVVGVIVVIFLIFIIYFYQQVNTTHDNAFGERQFIIEKGQGVEAIADNLQSQGFIKSPFWFKVYVASSGKRSEFVDGTFELRTDLSLKEIANFLTETMGAAKETEFTLLEGWSVEQMDESLASEGLIKAGELIEYSDKFNDKSFFFLIDKPRSADLQGYLYPDTYRVYQNSSVGKIAEKMLSNFDSKLTDEIRKEIKRQGKTVFEVVTLASIVEKEMFGYKNRQVVADIFNKRLEIGMALQSDATVNFVTDKGIAAPSLVDTQVDSLYNTYKYPGLPPGPICNPSIEAIKAVVYPEKTNYWYFLNTPEGDIIYSKNHDEHVTNKYKYLK